MVKRLTIVIWILFYQCCKIAVMHEQNMFLKGLHVFGYAMHKLCYMFDRPLYIVKGYVGILRNTYVDRNLHL